MNASTPIAASGSLQTDVALDIFTAIVVSADRLHVLRDLTHQAVAHFGRDLLFIRNVNVVPTNSGASWLATADFSTRRFDA